MIERRNSMLAGALVTLLSSSVSAGGVDNVALAEWRKDHEQLGAYLTLVEDDDAYVPFARNRAEALLEKLAQYGVTLPVALSAPPTPRTSNANYSPPEPSALETDLGPRPHWMDSPTSLGDVSDLENEALGVKEGYTSLQRERFEAMRDASRARRSLPGYEK